MKEKTSQHNASVAVDQTYTYTVKIHPHEPDEAPGYWVEVPALPGCFSAGTTVEEAFEHVHEAIEGHLEALRDIGEEIPIEENNVFERKVSVSAVAV